MAETAKVVVVFLMIIATVFSTSNCPQEKAPICASNGKTYRNKCYFDYYAKPQGHTLRFRGYCPPKYPGGVIPLYSRLGYFKQ